METTVAEIAPDIYRFSTFVNPPGLMFNQFLVDADQPLLFHTGPRALGGFNWSSQHLEWEVLDGSPSAGSRSCAAAKDEVSGSVGFSARC